MSLKNLLVTFGLLAGSAVMGQGSAIEERRLFAALPAGGRLEVENPYGDVRLRQGGESGTEVELFALLQPSPQGELLEVAFATTGDTLTATVRSTKESTARRPARADLVLFVPSSFPVRVTTGSGDGLIEAKGIRGSLHAIAVRGDIVAKGVKGGICAQSRSGTISAELGGTGEQQSLVTETGAIEAYLWEDADLTVTAATSGEISTDFSLQIDYRRSEEPSKMATAVLGKGTSSLRIESKQGRVRMLRLPRGFKKEGSNEGRKS